MAKQRTRVNLEIRAKEVRLIDSDGTQVGIVPMETAMSVAAERGLDLVEVAPEAKPPVCKIMDYGKYKYEQAKRSQVAKKKQTVIQVKEVKFRPKIEEHDFLFKVRNVKKFLDQKNRVKVTIMFRGREFSFTESGYALLGRVIEELGDQVVVEQPPKMEGRAMGMLLAPKT
ncbi:MAG: translation initiation factor IF-3 [Deltaproteobacteria bacterium]|nr:translation initiation factor IF-3 [Deltaproteobacteria bacterium]